MKIAIITLFPDMFSALQYGICQRAQNAGLIAFFTINPRDYADNKHGHVDDRPYGGGPGMVMMYPPLAGAITQAKILVGSDAQVIYLSPQGLTLTQAIAKKYVSQAHPDDHSDKSNNLILLCGRYEGIDQRLIDNLVDIEISIGDYVLSGGEFAAMVFIDTVTRLLPGALGHESSADEDSFSDGLLDHPHYTRPECIGTQCVPPVLLSGDHEKIKRWRAEQALSATQKKRPDLLQNNESQD